MKLFKSKPNWIEQFSDNPTRYGYLTDLSADQIAYAAQSSEAGFIVSMDDEVKFNILSENYNYSDEKMYVSFINNEANKGKLSRIISRPLPKGETDLKNLNVEFEVRHIYFDILIRAVNNIQPQIIERILPSRESFLPLFDVPISYVRQLLPQTHDFDIDREDQLRALHTILSCNPR